MTPAPRESGAATIRSPTRPTVTRTHSSSPIGESSLRVIVACSLGLSRGGSPSQCERIGSTKISPVSAHETG